MNGLFFLLCLICLNFSYIQVLSGAADDRMLVSVRPIEAFENILVADPLKSKDLGADGVPLFSVHDYTSIEVATHSFIGKNGLRVETQMPARDRLLQIKGFLTEHLQTSLRSIADQRYKKQIAFEIANIESNIKKIYEDYEAIEKMGSYALLKNNQQKMKHTLTMKSLVFEAYLPFVKTMNNLFSLSDQNIKQMNDLIQKKDYTPAKILAAEKMYHMLHQEMFQFFKRNGVLQVSDGSDVVQFLTVTPKSGNDWDYNEYTLGYLFLDGLYRPFVINKSDSFSANSMGSCFHLIAQHGVPVRHSGFLLHEKRSLLTIGQLGSHRYDVLFIEGAHSEHPFAFTKALSVELDDVQTEQIPWDIADIYCLDALKTPYGFFSVPHNKIEMELATIQLIECIEERVQDLEHPLSLTVLAYLNQNIQKTVYMIMAEGQDFEALSCVEVDIEDTEDPALHKKVLEQLAQTKEMYTEKLLSAYEEQIIKEQETRKAAVIAGSVAGRSKENKSKGKGKKGKKQQRLVHQKIAQDTEKPVNDDRKQVRIEALDRFREQSQKAKVKLRHMTKVINAISKKYKMDGVNVRVKGSHCNFDAGEGQTQSFVLPHGKKDGVSFGVANKFFNALAQTMAVLDLKD